MEKGLVKIYFGEGKGKSTSSMGRALVCAGEEKEVFVIQFLKGKMTGSLDYLKRLEPEIKVFRFEREEAFSGCELVHDTHRLALMNAMLHDIEGEIKLADTLSQWL